MKKILVTGGLGYIGSHTVVELANSGYEPIILDNLSNADLTVLDKIEQIIGRKPIFAQVEMCDPVAMNAFFEANKGIDAVIHFAAYLLVDESVKEPLKYYRNNLLSTINLLHCMEQYEVPSLVFSSSCTVYGNPDVLPVTEETPTKPAASPYGNTKKMCEEIISDASKASTTRAISLRYFNPIGAHTSALIGEIPHGVPSHLVPYITETAIGKRASLSVFGDDYNTRDGSCIRDYIHVVDLAKAHICAVQRLINKTAGDPMEVINIGSGNGQTVLEIIAAFQEATGIAIPYTIAPRRAGDVEAVYADTSKAKKLLNWNTELSLVDMLRSAWKWEQQRDLHH